MSDTYDYFIIGQGLAGSLLALSLIDKGNKVLVIDNEHQDSSSIVAAGLINPLAGLRFSHPNLLSQWLTSSKKCYSNLEKRFSIKLYHQQKMLRIFHNEEQKDYWHKRKDDPFIGKIADNTESISMHLGACLPKETGYLDMPLLLKTLQDFLKENASLITSNFNHADLTLSKTIQWQGYQAKKLIFCEGYRGLENPWFSDLPFAPVKGEIIQLKADDNLPNYIVNKKFWLIPQADNSYRLGATIDRNNLDNNQTKAGLNILKKAFHSLFPEKEMPEVINHKAGVRPSTKDRQPFIGPHPSIDNFYIFNGFGGRGVLTMPYYIDLFLKNLIDGELLPEEVDIKRFKKFNITPHPSPLP